MAPGPDVVIDVATLRQRITGFGASSAWHADGLTDERADMFFSPSAGLGLSLLRMRIAPDGTTVETNTALKARARGVGVWAAPWSPPGSWKTSGTDNQGGHLLPEYYDEWAVRLVDFVLARKNQGVPLIALSAQNEPDWVAEWETCEWTPEELTTFIRDHLGPELSARAPETRLLAPESANWDSLAAYANAILGDEAARDEVGIIAVHDYGGTPYAYAAPAEHGKEFWETEISYHDFTGIDAALQTASAVHEHMTVPQVNAFHYWWLLSGNPDAANNALYADGQLTPQAYGLGQYSKFIRPGFYRVESSQVAPATGVLVSAYFDPPSGKLVIVAVNATASAVEQTFGIAGSGVVSMVPWTTNETYSLTAGTWFAVGDTFSYSLDAKSVTTFVGEARRVDPGSGGAGGESGTEGGAAGEAGAPAGSGGDDAGGAGGEPENAAGESGAGAGAPGTGGIAPGSGGETSSGGDGVEPSAGAPNGSGGVESGTGGSSAGRGGRGGRGGSKSTDDDEDRPRPGNACACRTAGASHGRHGAWIGVVGLGLWLRARRRQRSAA